MTEDEPVGKAKGGFARAEVLAPKKRRDIARAAAKARWDTSIPVAEYIGDLTIGDLTLPCAVLPDDTRVISLGGMATAFGPVVGGWQMRKAASGESGDLPPFLVAASLQQFISEELRTLVSNPRKYRDPRGGPIRSGFDATLLPQVCDVWLQARDQKALTKIQVPVANRADILMRGLAKTGIIALVDEATGYQRYRAENALARILEAFIAKELQPYVRTFPRGFYQEIFRLRGLEYPRDSVRRPQYFGVITNDIVYKRLAPGVKEELKRLTPKNEDGRHKHKLFQRLNANFGYPKLREHLGSVVTIMKLSESWHDFMSKLDRLHPRYGETMELPFNYEQAKDDGKGL